MFVLDEIKDYSRYTSLTFIDFLEALGRAADMKSLPNAEDIEEAGSVHTLGWLASEAYPVQRWSVYLHLG